MTDEEIKENLNMLASSYTVGSLRMIGKGISWSEGVALWRAMIDSLIEHTADGKLMDADVYKRARVEMQKVHDEDERVEA